MSVMDGHLDEGISLGYHAHNNFQMGYANAISFLSSGRRRLVVDGTLYGMARARQAPLELLAMYMNAHEGGHYDIIRCWSHSDGGDGVLQKEAVGVQPVFLCGGLQ